MSEPTGFGWVKLYHRSGALVTLPVPDDRPYNYAAAMGNVEAAIAAGFLVTAPGLEEGEQKDVCGYVVRRSKGDGTPIIDLYVNNDALRNPLLSHYLNNQEEAAAFEAATGLKVLSLPKYIGDNKIERGKKKETDELVVKLTRPAGFIYKRNPAYSEEEAKAVAARGKGEIYGTPKRKFLRWAEAPAPGSGAGRAEQHEPIVRSPNTPGESYPRPNQTDKVVDELPTVERLCNWYSRATAAQVAGLEGYRKRMFFGATDSEKVAMTAASDACKLRLGLIGVGPENTMGSHHDGPIPF